MNKRRLLPILLVGALAIVGVATRGFGLLGREDGPLTLYGNVDIREVQLGFRVGGRISSILVDEGQKVVAGVLLATLDAVSQQSRLAEADAQIAQAQADLLRLTRGSRAQDKSAAQARLAAAQATAADAERDYARRQPLVEPGAISRAAWDETVAQRDRARAQLAEARAALSLAKEGPRTEEIAAARARLAAARAVRQRAGTDEGDTRLTASLAGTVVTRAQEPGAIVQPGEPLLTLAIEKPLRVRAYVGETALSRINPGMKVEVRADGNPRAYSGTIGWISPRAEFTPKSVETEDLRTDLVYRLRILVDHPDDALRQGQPVTVRVAAARPAAD